MQRRLKKLSTLPGLLEDPSVVGLLCAEVQQLQLATTMVHQQCYGTKQEFLVRAVII